MNARILAHHAAKLGQTVHLYYSKDLLEGVRPGQSDARTISKLGSSTSDDSMGRLPLFCGMKVMVTENIAFSNRVVNGAEGVIEDIQYSVGDDGHRTADAVYIRIRGAGLITDELGDDIVPIFPVTSSFKWKVKVGSDVIERTVTRVQLPIVPAYAFTDYKSQGRSVSCAIVDLTSARSLEAAYVMLSRVRSLDGLAILRHFPPDKVLGRPSQEIREELARLDRLDELTRVRYERTMAHQ